MATRRENSIRRLAVLFAAAVALSAIGVATPFAPYALADDGDGDGGGGGSGSGAGSGGAGSGGDSGGVGDTWRKRQASQVRCTCSFLFICSCSSRAPRRNVASTPARREPAKPAARPEIIASGIDDGAIAVLRQRGFTLLGQRQSPLLDSTIVRFAVPEGRSADYGLRILRNVGGNTIVATRNDAYRRLMLKYKPAGKSCGNKCETFAITEWTAAAGSCSANAQIGIIDTGIDPTHPSLQGARMKLKSLRSADRKASDSEHGTAVASLLVGQNESLVAGLAPKAHLFAADAFHHNGTSSAADAYDLIASFDWFAEENVKLVNLSLSGPDNALLKAAIAKAQLRGMRLVAAAGKPGENSSTGFPARYDGVIAVSAVDSRLRPSRHSIRGEHITFAAPGVGVVVAAPNGALRSAEGTSFAAPFVTAAMAAADHRISTGTTADPLQRLTATAKDLGAPGRDSIFGWGLIQFSGLRECNK